MSTTLKDIDIVRKAADISLENYNRRCRRIVAILMAGRSYNGDYRQHGDFTHTEARKAAAEIWRRNLEEAVVTAATAESYPEVV